MTAPSYIVGKPVSKIVTQHKVRFKTLKVVFFMWLTLKQSSFFLSGKLPCQIFESSHVQEYIVYMYIWLLNKEWGLYCCF